MPAIDALREVYQRGAKANNFRNGVYPVDLHWSISALSFFNLSKRHTFALTIELGLDSPQAVRTHRRIVAETIVRHAGKKPELP